MKIITITINPAYDIHYYIDDFKSNNEYYCNDRSKHAAGKGINISKALSVNGIDSTAFIITGKRNSSDYIEQLKSFEHIKCEYLEIDGDIRENITIHSKSGETKICQEENDVRFEHITELFSMIRKIVDDKTYVVFSGRIPKGIDCELLINELLKLKESGANLIVDTSSFTYNQIKQISPWLIKPNVPEFINLTGIKEFDISDVKTLLMEKFDFCNVLLSLGKDGALIYFDKQILLSKAPEIKPKSTIGAGDSMIAGFLSSYTITNDISKALKCAVAYGSAKCLSEGTNPPITQNIELLMKDIIITKM